MLNFEEIREIDSFISQNYIPFKYIAYNDNQKKLERLINLLPIRTKIKLSIVSTTLDIHNLTQRLKKLQYLFTIKKEIDRYWLTIIRKKKKLKKIVPTVFDINFLDIPEKELSK